MSNTFSTVLKTIMKERKLTQIQVAEILNVRQSQVSNWLNGKSLPGFNSLIAMCKNLKVSPYTLLGLDEVK